MFSCITILLIIIPYFISVMSVVLVMFVLTDQISFNDIIFAWVPILTSSVNPIIIVIRRKNVREAITELLGYWPRRVIAAVSRNGHGQLNGNDKVGTLPTELGELIDLGEI